MLINCVFSPLERNEPRADDLDDPVGFDYLQKRRYLIIAARDLKDDRGGLHIDDVRAEQLAHLQHVETIVIVRPHLDECHPPTRRALFVQPLNRPHDGHLFQLLDHLLDEIPIPLHHDRDAREIRRLRHADRQAVDVELTPRKHAHNAHQNPRLVLNKDGQYVFHDNKLLSAAPQNCLCGKTPSLSPTYEHLSISFG